MHGSMLGALDLLVALGRDDLPDSFPPQMTMILYCPIAKSPAPLRLRARSFCLLYELAKQSAAHNDTPANLKKIQYDLLFSRRGAGARSEQPPALCNRTAHTDDRINLSQSSRSSQRPMLVIGEILKKVARL